MRDRGKDGEHERKDRKGARERDRERAEKRAHELVGRMTLEERASQLRYDAPAIPRLGVPAYNWWNEGLHGVARAGVATSFPQAIGMAASFDRELLKEAGRVTAVEGRAKYNSSSAEGDRDIYKGLTFWSPNINIFRDPRWGRGHETYGEDPFLAGELGKAYVEGMQGDGEYMTAAACAKHFAVHSGPEKLRHKFDARVSEKDLRETYLPAFEKLVREAGVEAVMGAYNRTNGEPCCGSKTLIQDILRGEWGFRGHFVSDCWAIRDFHTNHMVTDTAEESAAMALKNGCDVNCGNTYLHILKAYEDGLVTEEEITQAAERLFTTRFLLGLFDETEYDGIGFDRLECAGHLRAADRATAESVVLLKNNGILPLRREGLGAIGVIGPNANSRVALVGNYHGTSSRYITVLEGIQDLAGEEIRVFYSEGCHLCKDKVESLAQKDDRISEAVNVARNSDVVILCVGLDETLEGEEGDTGNRDASGDKVDLQLPRPQRALMEAVIGVGKPVVVLNMTGSAMDLRYAQERADAVMQVWYPGARGGRTVARVLFGEISPSGKLPVTFYNSAEELPAFEDYSMRGRTYRYFEGTPLYPFGYGLTYGNVSVDKAFGFAFYPAECMAERPTEGLAERLVSGGTECQTECQTECAAECPTESLAECRGECQREHSVEGERQSECQRERSGERERQSECQRERSGEQERQGQCREYVFGPGGEGLLEMEGAEQLSVKVILTNNSSTDTGEVVQVYVKNLDSVYDAPNAKLCGFSRVFLPGGGSAETTVKIPREAFEVVTDAGERVQDGHRFRISVGLGQPDERTRELSGRECISFTVKM